MFGSVKKDPSLRILNIAFYRFQEIEDRDIARDFFLTHCTRFKLKGTVLLAREGINSNLAGEEAAVREFQKVLNSTAEWAGLDFKESYSSEVPFYRLRVRRKKEIIPCGDESVQPSSAQKRLRPQELKEWLDQKKPVLLLDTRNEFEIQFGTFENAESLGLRKFRDFGKRLKKMDEEKKKIPMVMFCTGGIRCEKASIVAERAGFEEVYQLEGGILRYFEEVGNSHYKGDCFVFDERGTLDATGKQSSSSCVKE